MSLKESVARTPNLKLRELEERKKVKHAQNVSPRFKWGSHSDT